MTTRTKTEILSQIKLDNIIQYSLSQSTLQSNFKAIMQALHDHDDGITELSHKFTKSETNLKGINDRNEKMERQQKQMKDSLQELKSLVKSISESDKNKGKRVDNPEENKNTVLLLEDLTKEVAKNKSDIAKMSEKVESNESRSEKNREILAQEIEKLKKQLLKRPSSSSKNNSSGDNDKIMNQLRQKMKEITKIGEENSKKISQLSKMGNLSKKLEKQFKEIHEKLQKFINQEYSPNKQNTWNKISQLQKNLKENTAIINEEKRLRSKMSEQLWKMSEKAYKGQESNLLSEMNADSIKQLQKQIIDLNKKINSLLSNNSNKNNEKNNDKLSTMYDASVFDTSRNVDSSNKKNDRSNLSPQKMGNNNNSNNNNGESLDDLRNEMMERLRDQRNQFMRILNKLELKNGEGSDDEKKRIQSLEEAILRIEHLLGDKADIGTMKKLLGYLENKINYLFHMISGKDSEEDAVGARKNWFCLSCDKTLDRYQGKIGSHLATSKLKGRPHDQDMVGGGMNLRHAKSKVDLPQVKSTNMISKKL